MHEHWRSSTQDEAPRVCTLVLFINLVAPMFDLDPKCAIWIIRKSSYIVLWPHGGIFSGLLLAVGGVHEVKGQPLNLITQNLGDSAYSRKLS